MNMKSVGLGNTRMSTDYAQKSPQILIGRHLTTIYRLLICPHCAQNQACHRLVDGTSNYGGWWL